VRLPVIALLVLAILVVRAAPARATPAQELERARQMFRGGKFAEAIPSLNYLLYPDPRLSQPEDLVEAHVLLGVSAFETGDQATAKREFEEALFLDRALTLDTLLFSKAAVEYFESVKHELQERARRDAEQRRLAEENERLQARLRAMVVIETHPYYINFIPFGAGQFQNGERRKGLFFAVTEGFTGAVSAGIWLYLVGEYGLPGKVDPARAESALRLQQVEIAAGGICLGLMAWGVIDSLLHYKPSVKRAPDESLLPPEERKKLPSTSLLVLPGGGGLSLTWEY